LKTTFTLQWCIFTYLKFHVAFGKCLAGFGRSYLNITLASSVLASDFYCSGFIAFIGTLLS
jgi:hypothetical protein